MIGLRFEFLGGKGVHLSHQIYAVPILCCIVTQKSVESVEGVFGPVVSSAIAVFEHVKDEFAVNLVCS